MKTLFASTLTLLLTTMALGLKAEVAIIVHPQNTGTVSKSQVEKIFLGKKSVFDDGTKAVPVNLPEGNSARDEFNEKVLDKNARQIKTYWAKLIFTGKGRPPEEAPSPSKMLEMVANNKEYIGYIDASLVDDSVRVVAKY